jgi:hypothetical protein
MRKSKKKMSYNKHMQTYSRRSLSGEEMRCERFNPLIFLEHEELR